MKDSGFEIGDRAEKGSIGLIELLILEGLSVTRIASHLGLIREDSSKQEKESVRSKLRQFIKIKWSMSVKELFTFLRINDLGYNVRGLYIDN